MVPGNFSAYGQARDQVLYECSMPATFQVDLFSYSIARITGALGKKKRTIACNALYYTSTETVTKKYRKIGGTHKEKVVSTSSDFKVRLHAVYFCAKQIWVL